MAEELAPAHHIVAVARTVGALENLDDRLRGVGGSATLAPMDLTEPEAMAQLCRSIHDRWSGLDIWVHTAVHAPPLSPVDHIDAKDFAAAQAVNINATATLIRMIAPLLTRPGAKALFFDDPHLGEKFFGAYAAAKSAQIALVRAWAAETARIGPEVHVLAPDAMPTAMRARFFPGENRGALADPHDVARRLLGSLR